MTIQNSNTASIFVDNMTQTILASMNCVNPRIERLVTHPKIPHAPAAEQVLGKFDKIRTNVCCKLDIFAKSDDVFCRTTKFRFKFRRIAYWKINTIVYQQYSIISRKFFETNRQDCVAVRSKISSEIFTLNDRFAFAEHKFKVGRRQPVWHAKHHIVTKLLQVKQFSATKIGQPVHLKNSENRNLGGDRRVILQNMRFFLASLNQ